LALLPPPTVLNLFRGSAPIRRRGLLLELLSNSDLATVARLIDATDPEYAFNRPDLHYTEGVTIFSGTA